MNRLALIIVLVTASLVVPSPGYGDRWNLPTTRTFHSANLRYRLVVTPRYIESQLAYFEGRVADPGPPGSAKRPFARFGSRHVIGYTAEHSFPLVNDVAPVTVLLDNRGQYVVTFDNWHLKGLGDDVIVLYRSSGDVIRKWGLDQLLTDNDILLLSRTSSSIHWGGPHRIDERAKELVLSIGPPQNGALDLRREVRIDLATGERRGTRQDFWPFGVAAVTPAATTSLPVHAPSAEEQCIDGQTFDSNARTIPSAQLLDAASVRPLPDYPAIAKAAGVTGSVVVEVLVRRGEAVCARAISGPRLLVNAAQTAALGWRFNTLSSPAEGSDVGRIAFEFTKLW